MSLEDLWGAGEFDPGVGQYRHQLLAKCLHLLPRVPDFADAQVPFRPEENVESRPAGLGHAPACSRRRTLSSYFSLVTFVGLKRTTMLMTILQGWGKPDLNALRTDVPIAPRAVWPGSTLIAPPPSASWPEGICPSLRSARERVESRALGAVANPEMAAS